MKATTILATTAILLIILLMRERKRNRYITDEMDRLRKELNKAYDMIEDLQLNPKAQPDTRTGDTGEKRVTETVQDPIITRRTPVIKKDPTLSFMQQFLRDN